MKIALGYLFLYGDDMLRVVEKKTGKVIRISYKEYYANEAKYSRDLKWKKPVPKKVIKKKVIKKKVTTETKGD